MLKVLLVTASIVGGPLWWFVKSRQESGVRRRQWLAMAVGFVLFVIFAKTPVPALKSFDTSSAALVYALIRLVGASLSCWLFLWGVRGRLVSSTIRASKIHRDE